MILSDLEESLKSLPSFPKKAEINPKMQNSVKLEKSQLMKFQLMANRLWRLFAVWGNVTTMQKLERADSLKKEERAIHTRFCVGGFCAQQFTPHWPRYFFELFLHE